jgi:hypothetical protein
VALSIEKHKCIDCIGLRHQESDRATGPTIF